MTKEEADRRVADALRATFDAARNHCHAVDRATTLSRLAGAVADVLEAESARAALDRPKLLPARTRAAYMATAYFEHGPNAGAHVQDFAEKMFIKDRADTLAAAEALPRYSARGEPTRFNGNKIEWDHGAAILLSDLRALINGDPS